ncbi:tryptophan synthase beta subunit-like PLP-dependent enzyme [Lipomyces arxii]|uniref:tryptophan synthase beta subunit-like PLP-dependent enzyme n=1 Tax=Lipomyces arxii TaxID=56418 RepID=UPI0034CD7466
MNDKVIDKPECYCYYKDLELRPKGLEKLPSSETECCHPLHHHPPTLANLANDRRKADPSFAPPPLQDSILDLIGNTPLIRLNQIPKQYGVKATILAKLEYFNAGGSVKDRIAKRMIEDAEKSGRIKPGYTLIEPTSGNTGIGLALVAAVKGYKTIITMPEKMSQEKVFVLKALGAEIVRTPTEAPWDSPQSHIGVARKLQQEIPNAVILDQYANINNPLAHEYGTGAEIWEQTGGNLVAVIAGAGTGGTITGIGRSLKKHDPAIKVIGVDPKGSILAQPESLNSGVGSYKVEGIGYDFIPDVLDRSVVDEWIKTDDTESFHLARKLISEEGILCGGSSGSALAGALKYAQSLDEHDTIVVVLPDSVRSYLTKFVSDDWMRENGFQQDTTVVDGGKKFKEATIADLNLSPVNAILETEHLSKAIQIMKAHGYDQLPVTDSDGLLVGLVTLSHILRKISSKKATTSSLVSDAMLKFNRLQESVPTGHDYSFSTHSRQARRKHDHYDVITKHTPLSALTDFFEFNSAAVVTEDGGGKHARPVHIVTKVDLLEYLVKNGEEV